MFLLEYNGKQFLVQNWKCQWGKNISVRKKFSKISRKTEQVSRLSKELFLTLGKYCPVSLFEKAILTFVSSCHFKRCGNAMFLFESFFVCSVNFEIELRPCSQTGRVTLPACEQGLNPISKIREQTKTLSKRNIALPHRLKWQELTKVRIAFSKRLRQHFPRVRNSYLLRRELTCSVFHDILRISYAHLYFFLTDIFNFEPNCFQL